MWPRVMCTRCSSCWGWGYGGGEVVVAVPGEGRGGRDLDSVGEVRYEVGLVFICQGMGLQCVFFI